MNKELLNLMKRTICEMYSRLVKPIEYDVASDVVIVNGKKKKFNDATYNYLREKIMLKNKVLKPSEFN